jgi:hypothetical protein
MQHKLRTEAGKAIYKMRKAVVEPIFGQIKERRNFRRFSFSLRGQDNVCAEWKLVCATSNLLKLFRYGLTPEIALKRPREALFHLLVAASTTRNRVVPGS